MVRILYLTSLLVFLLISVASTAFSSASVGWTLIKEPARLVNGSPVLFRVNAPQSVHTLTGTWLGHDIEFSFDAAHKNPGLRLPGSARRLSLALIPCSCAAKLLLLPPLRAHLTGTRFLSKRKFWSNGSAIPGCC